jgi:hypothetical protein
VNGFNDMVGFIWSVADLLRGDYKQAEYGKVILPLTVLRRLDCVLEPTKPAVLAKVKDLGGRVGNLDPILRRAADQPFYNVSPLDFRGLLADPEHIAQSLRLYIDPALSRSWTSTGSTQRSPAWTAPTCSIRSSPGSRTSTCTPTTSPTCRWATSSKS